MASSIALRRASSLINKFRSASIAPSTISRSFATNNQMREYSEDDERTVDVDRRSDSISRRRDRDSFFSGNVFDPFSPSRSLSQVLNMVDQMMEHPFTAPSRGIGTGLRRGWDAKEDENALYLKVDMPGLGKEHVKVSVEQNTLVIRGEGEKESEEEEAGRRYTGRIDLPEKLFKTDEIKAEMKHGVLKVVVPKVKEDERKDVYQVQVE